MVEAAGLMSVTARSNGSAPISKAESLVGGGGGGGLPYMGYLTIIPQARMGSQSIAHEAEG